MSTETITQKLHALADKKLREKLEASIAWIWQETGHADLPLQCKDDFLKSVRGSGLGNSLKDIPYVGEAMTLLTETGFAYLRDKYREIEVRDFMSKVESMARQMEELGLAVAASEEAQG